MEINETSLPGVYIIKRKPFIDERGSFYRMFCRRELEAVGLCGEIAQVNLSVNKWKGTLRGLHSQKEAHAEDKIVTCINGEIYDVCVDVRKGSSSYGQYHGETLTAENGLSLYIPKGFAHGYLSLTDNTSTLYFTTQYYQPGAEVGYKYNDPRFGIKWPLKPPYIISDKDNDVKWTEKRNEGILKKGMRVY